MATLKRPTNATASSTIRRLKQEAKAEAEQEVKELEQKAVKNGIPKSSKLLKLVHPTNGDSAEVADAVGPMKPTVTGRKAKRTFVMPEVKPKVQKERKPPAPKRMTEADIIAKYPHAVKGTLVFDEGTRKQSIMAKLQCGHKALVHTSDLFQVKRCPNCRKAKDQAKFAEMQKKQAEKASGKKAKKAQQ